MALFRKSQPKNRCPECVSYVMVDNKAYCSKNAPENVDLRKLSKEGLLRVCVPCPKEMTCPSFKAR